MWTGLTPPPFEGTGSSSLPGFLLRVQFILKMWTGRTPSHDVLKRLSVFFLIVQTSHRANSERSCSAHHLDKQPCCDGCTHDACMQPSLRGTSDLSETWLRVYG